jgi:hypothetical protein
MQLVYLVENRDTHWAFNSFTSAVFRSDIPFSSSFMQTFKFMIQVLLFFLLPLKLIFF